MDKKIERKKKQCPTCYGLGYCGSDDCEECGGDGEVSVNGDSDW